MTLDKEFADYGVRCSGCNQIRHANVHISTTIDIDDISEDSVSIDYPKLEPAYSLDDIDPTIHVKCPICGDEMEWIEPKLYPMFKAFYALGFTVVNISDGVAKAGRKVYRPSMSFLAPVYIDPQYFIDADKEAGYKIDIEFASLGKSKSWITNQIVRACFREDRDKMNILSITPHLDGIFTRLAKNATRKEVSTESIINDSMLMRLVNMAIIGYMKASNIQLPSDINEMVTQNKFINQSLETVIFDSLKDTEENEG